jgi:hypothetical protein
MLIYSDEKTNRTLLTYLVKHERDFSAELAKAKKVAEYAI